MLCTFKGIEQAEARRMRECVPTRFAARTSTTTAPPPSTASAPTAMRGVIAVLIVLGVAPGAAVGVPVPARALAAVPVVPLLAEVLGPPLQPTPLLVASHRDEGLLDQHDRVVGGGSRGIRS
ncbi:hypothetical protein [Agromyces laixinhei]|uniref:hypothetical protein n=1 Tax=Agromyces laixinhei TaxID=2585717 RepID=UPI001E3B0F02|nr:hypothetical protein [Agromyces laixinhei]